MKINSQHKCFGGLVQFYEHQSEATASPMRFSIFLPESAVDSPQKHPWLLWLSGLTCTEENFMIKSGAQRYLAEKGIICVAPDTSPRDLGTPGETDRWDLGAGASYYVNATRDPWAAHYQMYDYVSQELPALIRKHFSVDPDRGAISGHSMGGHGALLVGLRNPGDYRSISAFAPISSAHQSEWGTRALEAFLGPYGPSWDLYDASKVVSSMSEAPPILIDQGSQDEFLKSGQLNPTVFMEAARSLATPLEYRERHGYDHGYFYVASFFAEHVDFHAKHLGL